MWRGLYRDIEGLGIEPGRVKRHGICNGSNIQDFPHGFSRFIFSFAFGFLGLGRSLRLGIVEGLAVWEPRSRV